MNKTQKIFVLIISFLVLFTICIWLWQLDDPTRVDAWVLPLIITAIIGFFLFKDK